MFKKRFTTPARLITLACPIIFGATASAAPAASSAAPALDSTTSGSATTGSATARPNVVFIYADDVGYGDLSCYGATSISTPHLDELARRGLRFTNARSAAATCTPSRYSIMTGQYAWRKKGTGVLPGDANLIVPTDIVTLPRVFQKAGYVTGCVGKWHLGLGSGDTLDWNRRVAPGPNEIGFDYSFIFPATADRVPTVYMRNGEVVGLDPADPILVSYKEKIGTEPTGKENPELLYNMRAAENHGHDGTIVNGIGRIGWMTGGQRARWTDESLAMDFTQEAEDFMERHAAQPFFLYFATNDIHVPRMPGARFKGVSGLGYRGDALLQLDDTVGRLMTRLRHLGIEDNTIVIFSSDNGPVLNDGYVDGAVEQLGAHTPTGPFRGGKYSALEGGTRLPFIVQWPASIQPGVSPALVSQVDLIASFAAFTGQALPDDYYRDSQNMMPALLGKDRTGRESVVVRGRTYAYIKGDWKYILPSDGPAVLERTGVESGLLDAPQLYNLEADPRETNNLATQHPDRVKEMRAELQSIRDAHRDGIQDWE